MPRLMPSSNAREEVADRDRVQADYSQTLGREQRLHKVVEDTKVEMDKQNARVLQYSQLKRDAENDKKLYERYGLTKDEIAFVESIVNPMDADK